MNIKNILIIQLVLSFLVGCSVEEKKLNSVLHATTNYVKINNASSDTLYINVSHIDNFILSGSDRIDMIYPHDSIAFKVDIGLPLILQVLMNNKRRSFYLFPGKNRTIEYTQLELKEIGVNSSFYKVIDELQHEFPLNGNSIWSKQPEFIEYLDSYKAAQLEFIEKNEQELDSELKVFIEDEIHFQYLDFVCDQIGAHYIFFDTLLTIPDSILTKVKGAVHNEEKYDRPFYRKLVQNMGRLQFLNNYDFQEAPKNIQDKYKESIISFIDKELSPDFQQEILVDYVLTQKLRGKQFNAAMEDSIMGILNNKYKKFYKAKDALITQHFNEEDFVTNIESLKNLNDLDSNSVQISLEDFPATKLIKLWFKGCAFCQKTIPIDKEIAQNKVDTEVIYIAYNTTYDYYKEYSAKNKLRQNNITSLYYGGDKEALRGTFGKLYAPKYSLVSRDTVICSGCKHNKNDLLYYFEE